MENSFISKYFNDFNVTDVFERFSNKLSNCSNTLWYDNEFEDYEKKIWLEDEDSYKINIPAYLDETGDTRYETNITVENNLLKIDLGSTAKDWSTSFKVEVTLPENSDYDNISAYIENNTLTVVVPKKK